MRRRPSAPNEGERGLNVLRPLARVLTMEDHKRRRPKVRNTLHAGLPTEVDLLRKGAYSLSLAATVTVSFVCSLGPIAEPERASIDTRLPDVVRGTPRKPHALQN